MNEVKELKGHVKWASWRAQEVRLRVSGRYRKIWKVLVAHMCTNLDRACSYRCAQKKKELEIGDGQIPCCTCARVSNYRTIVTSSVFVF